MTVAMGRRRSSLRRNAYLASGELRRHRGPDAGIGVLERGQEPIDDHRGREVLMRDDPGRREPHIEVAVLQQFEERDAKPGREVGMRC